jgi:hypothetical protein
MNRENNRSIPDGRNPPAMSDKPDLGSSIDRTNGRTTFRPRRSRLSIRIRGGKKNGRSVWERPVSFGNRHFPRRREYLEMRAYYAVIVFQLWLSVSRIRITS